MAFTLNFIYRALFKAASVNDLLITETSKNINLMISNPKTKITGNISMYHITPQPAYNPMRLFAEKILRK